MSQKSVIVYSTPDSHKSGQKYPKDDNNNRESMSSPNKDNNSLYYPWLWSDSAQSIQLSPLTSTWRSNTTEESPNPFDLNSSSTKRGRPRLEEITGLILSGSTSPSAIKCGVCNRVFPREKSLQAHMRTHTGERPYKCDFPDCSRAFAQSGQLRTHQRLHTGEKPFVCDFNGCNNRFTHANRRCSLHPRSGVRRLTDPSDDEMPTNSSAKKVLKINKNIGNTVNISKKSERKTKSEKRKDSHSRRSVISHAGRAARKLHQELDAEADDENDNREKIMGALALMELAGSAPIEIGSEVCIDVNENEEQIPTIFWSQI